MFPYHDEYQPTLLVCPLHLLIQILNILFSYVQQNNSQAWERGNQEQNYYAFEADEISIIKLPNKLRWNGHCSEVQLKSFKLNMYGKVSIENCLHIFLCCPWFIKQVVYGVIYMCLLNTCLLIRDLFLLNTCLIIPIYCDITTRYYICQHPRHPQKITLLPK